MENKSKIVNVLLIEDNPGDARLIGEMLSDNLGVSFQLKFVNRVEAGLRYLASGGIDVVLLDLNLPDSQGLETLGTVRSAASGVPIIVLTGDTDASLGMRAVNEGAQDYLVKGQVDGNLLLRSILYSIQRHRLIFELRQYALRLHTSHFRLQTIMEQNADGIVIANKKGVALYVNPAAEQLLGMRREEMQNKPVGIPITETGAREVVLPRPDDEEGVAEVRVVEIEWEGEGAYLASMRDITERRRMREILGQAAREWQSTFDAVEDMIVVLDRDQHIIRANQAVKDTFQGQPIFGEPCYRLFHGCSTAVENCAACETFNTGEACHIELQEPHLGDRWLMMSSYPIKGPDGVVDKVVHVIRDTTEARRTEAIKRSLEAKQLVLQELKEVNEMKSQFIEVMAHELRTPMTVIRSGVGLLLEQSLGELNGKQREFLQVIDRNIDRLSRFSQDVLSLSKLDSGRFRMHPEEVELHAALHPTLEMLRIKAEEDKIEINTEGLTEEGLLVCSDVDALSQVAFNLVNNAIMHCPEGTKVWVEGQLLEDQFVEATVRDDGPGIPVEAQERIFERFYQVGRQSGPGYRGTGIGLAVCRGLVEKMGGKMFVESAPGQGTTFKVKIPTPKSRAETLFGRIAMFLGHVTQEELGEAVRLQSSREYEGKKLGEILVDKGRLSRIKVDEVLQNQQFSLARPHKLLPATLNESLLGRIAQRYGYVTDDQLRGILRTQALRQEQGEPVRIGQVMVEQNLMTAEDVIMVLHMQKQQIMVCPACSSRFNSPRTQSEPELACPECGASLEADEAEVIEVSGDVE